MAEKADDDPPNMSYAMIAGGLLLAGLYCMGCLCCAMVMGNLEKQVYCEGLKLLRLWPPDDSYSYDAVAHEEAPEPPQLSDEDLKKAREEKDRRVIRGELTPEDEAEEEFKSRWIGEACLTLMVPWLEALCAYFIAPRTNILIVVILAILIAAPFIARTKVWERYEQARIARQDGVRFGDCLYRWHFWFGCVEIACCCINGAVVGAYLATFDTFANDRFEAGWIATPWPLGPFVANLGPAGTMILVISFSTWCAMGSATDMGGHAGADVAGATSLSSYMRRLDRTDWRKFGLGFVFFTRVFVENTLHLLLQSSLIMSLGGGLRHHPVLLATIALNTIVWFKKWGEHNIILQQPIYDKFFQLCLAGVIFAYIGFKLYFIETCPKHIWGITTGCIKELIDAWNSQSHGSLAA